MSCPAMQRCTRVSAVSVPCLRFTLPCLCHALLWSLLPCVRPQQWTARERPSRHLLAKAPVSNKWMTPAAEPPLTIYTTRMAQNGYHSGEKKGQGTHGWELGKKHTH